MAGSSFSGNLLGSFSGRGADVSPMQFIQEMRQRAIQAEQQKKLQQQQMAQSFTMALMAKKQQEAEMAQQGQQFQQSQAQRAAEHAQAGEQFRSEQERIREAARAQEELRKLGEARQLETERRLQAQHDETRALQGAAEDRRALGRNVQTATIRGLEQRFQAARGTDPLQALDAIESQALEETKGIDDPEAQAMAIAEVRQWRAEKEAQLGRRESLGSMIEGRKSLAADKAEGRKLQGERDAARAKTSSVRAQLATIKAQIDRRGDELSEARYLKDTNRVGALEKQIADLEAKEMELNQQLADME